jgi:hypothetical protein
MIAQFADENARATARTGLSPGGTVNTSQARARVPCLTWGQTASAKRGHPWVRAECFHEIGGALSGCFDTVRQLSWNGFAIKIVAGPVGP